MISLQEFNQDGLLQVSPLLSSLRDSGSWMRGRKKITWRNSRPSSRTPVSSWWKDGPVVKLQTVLRKNVFYTFDPKAMNHILLKEMNSFPPLRIETADVFLGKGLLGTVGDVHRRQRKMLNPVFSIAHMRSMMPMFNDIAQKLENTLNKRVQNGPTEARFGYSFDNMEDDVPKHKYRPRHQESRARPALGRLSLYIREIPPPALQTLLRKDTDFARILREGLRGEETALKKGDEAVMRQLGQGKDILSILMKDKSDADARG
ncbi:hypothetical protein BT96DRAFT_996976 [Gymnopus androsaceus JB14]|uniref:Cytochrome P450 n=1 Tax=Gymnopus androsaceus JB14 TaxID=1447944 RepID=A0A6A4HEN6_9AGAR|nr:hypothetical protein BT96DRAFT_996976 [Gymnopus androsaceus JB14]